MKFLKDNLVYALGVALLTVPLYPKFPLFFLPGTTVAVRLEDFVILTVGLLFLISNITQMFAIFKNKIVLSITLFFLIALSSVLSGAFLTRTHALDVGLLHLFRRVEYMSLFVMASFSIKKSEHIAFLIKITLVTFIYAFIYGFAQKYYGLPIITTQNSEYSKGAALFYREGSHLVSTFAGHYDMASYILFLSPMLYLLLFASRESLKRIFGNTHPYFARNFIILVIASGLWLLVNAASRISIVSYMGGVFLALLVIRKFKFIPIVFFFIILFVNSSSNLLSRYMTIFDVYIERLISVSAQVETPRSTPTPTPVPVFEDRSTSIRTAVEWPRAIRALRKNPIFGTGYSSITLATDNDYLRMLGETGIYGFISFFLAFSLIILNIFKKILNIKKDSLEGVFLVGILVAIPGVLLNMVFIDILEASKFAIIFWLMLGAAVGFATYEK